MANLIPIPYGDPLWNEPLDANLKALNEGKPDNGDVLPEIGVVNLTNARQYPFNNSETTVNLERPRNTLNYSVVTEIVTAIGSVGDVSVSDKQLNGFKLSYNGNATSATIKYYITGGFQE